MRIASVCGCALVLLSSSAYSEPDRTVGAKIRAQVPYAGLRLGEAGGLTFFGGSAAITFIDWVEIEGGGLFVGSPTFAGVHAFARAGVTPPLYDGRTEEGDGFALHLAGLVGYRYFDMEADQLSNDREKHSALVHGIALDLGIDMTYWFVSRFGLTGRLVGEVGFPVSAKVVRNDYAMGGGIHETGLEPPVFGGASLFLGVAF